MPPTVDPIYFPCLLRTGNWLIAARKEVVKVTGLKHLKDNVFCYPASVQDKMDYLHWLIQPDGSYREFRTLGYNRLWARPLRFFWSLVSVRSELTTGRSISIKELREKLAALQTDGPSISDELRFDLELLDFVKDRREEDLFSPAMFAEFMNEPLDQPWESYP